MVKLLERLVPQVKSNISNTNRVYEEKRLLDKYMPLNGVYDSSCETCNNCGSGNCNSCCGGTDD